MIIGCDLLNMLRARVDFKSKQFIHDTDIPNVVRTDNDTQLIGVLSDHSVTSVTEPDM